jgi:hypothetical protein
MITKPAIDCLLHTIFNFNISSQSFPYQVPINSHNMRNRKFVLNNESMKRKKLIFMQLPLKSPVELKVAVEWFGLLLRIREVRGSCNALWHFHFFLEGKKKRIQVKAICK